jgi:predicted nuclease of predicted toxin-antitoxin system
LSSPRILLDENIASRALVEALSGLGLDVLTVYDVGLHDSDDRWILEYALVHRLVVVTADRDFGVLAVRDGVPHFGIVSVRVSGFSESVARVVEVLAELGLPGPGELWSIRAHGVRRR